MKKTIALLLAVAMLLTLTACGGKEPNAGVYNAVSCTALGLDLDCEGDWLELKKGGKATLCLMGEEYFCKWTLEGETFTLKNHSDEFSGTLQNGIITLDYGDMIYVYIMDGVVTEAGEMLGHTHRWQDADCENSKTCTDCGATEGDPLGHTSTEANYQDAPVCTVCGETTGEVLQPDMEKYGITEFMEAGVVYPYTTKLGKSDNLTTGEVELLSYEIFPSSEEYPARDGYEWRVATFRMSFWGYSPSKEGVDPEYNIEDYYTIELLDDTNMYNETEDCDVYSVNYHGKLMEVTEYSTYTWGKWGWKNGERWVDGTIVYAYCVPEGYDGAVMGFRNAQVEWLDDMHLYEVYTPEDFLLFRLVNKDDAPASDDGGIVGTYSLYALEDSGEYIDNATLASLEMDGLVIITFNGDGTGVMSTEGEEVTFTYDDTKISDADGFTYEYVLEDGMLKVDVGNGQIFHCQKK